MALTFGWKAAEVRESHWIDDPDFVNVPDAARQAWMEDGDASHLTPYVKPGGKPDLITFRCLTFDEATSLRSLIGKVVGAGGSDVPQSDKLEAYSRARRLAFRMAVDFPGAPVEVLGPVDPRTGERVKYRRTVVEKGYRMLAEGFVDGLERAYPGIVGFYGGIVLNASLAQDDEKKASSQPSTPTPSPSDTASPGAAASDAPTP